MEALVPYPVTDANFVSSTAAESDHPAWVSGATYAAETRVIRAATHSIYERRTAGAGTVPPEDDEVNWVRVGPTNRWAMWDVDPASRTALASPLTVVFSVSGPWTDIVLMGVSGTSVTVTAAGVSKTQAVPAEAVAGQGATMVLSGMAGVAGNVTVSLTGSGTVAIGQLSIGVWVYCGDTQKGLELAGKSLSKTEWDEWGGLQIVRRGRQRRMNVPVSVPIAQWDQVVRVLRALRAQPCMWRGVSWVSSTVIWGVRRSWSLRREGRAPHATGTVQIVGLALGV